MSLQVLAAGFEREICEFEHEICARSAKVGYA